MPEKKNVIRLMGSIFIVDPLLGSPRKLAQKLQSECAEYDRLASLSPLPIDLPGQTPAEAPRAILTEASQVWQIVCTGTRINLLYFPAREDESQENTAPAEFWDLCRRLLPGLQTNLSLDVSRVSGVMHVRCDLEAAAVQRLKQTLFTPNMPDFFDANPYSAEWHFNNRIPWDSGEKTCELNRIVRVKAVRLSEERENEKVLFVETDINTNPDEPEIRFQEGEVSRFFEGLFDRNATIMEVLDEQRVTR
ncbi:MAG: hypothetical protein ACLFWL_13210 [Candidatus Brocadiia bacterium]